MAEGGGARLAETVTARDHVRGPATAAGASRARSPSAALRRRHRIPAPAPPASKCRSPAGRRDSPTPRRDRPPTTGARARRAAHPGLTSTGPARALAAACARQLLGPRLVERVCRCTADQHVAALAASLPCHHSTRIDAASSRRVQRLGGADARSTFRALRFGSAPGERRRDVRPIAGEARGDRSGSDEDGRGECQHRFTMRSIIRGEPPVIGVATAASTSRRSRR